MSSSSLCHWSTQAASEADVGWRMIRQNAHCIGVCSRVQACNGVCFALILSPLLHACPYRDAIHQRYRPSTTTSASRAHARLSVCGRNGGTPQRFAVVPRLRVEDGGGLADGVPFPWRRSDAGGGLVGGKMPSWSRAC